MVIYLYGPDSYRRREKIKSITAEYQKKHSDLTIQSFFIVDEAKAENEIGRLKDFVTAQSLFSIGGKKFGICVIEEAPETAAFPKLLKEFIDSETTTLLVSAQKKLPAAYKFLLDKPVLSQAFDELSAVELTAFIKKEAEKRGAALWPAAVSTLINRYGGDTWGIITELEVLSLGGKLEDAAASPEFFGLLMRVQRGDLAALTWLLEREEPAMIFNILASRLSGALKIKAADYDVAVKSGKLDYPEALFDLVLST